ncbi:uncharacterized protein HMPREF1541_01664 [Cyphellophora europaea CBS 101466]|uniref:Uncharacterized protein n=1 Tax=Cyphellophora europaea (strain CBS 101466) TaxID=1220924 RepID=W2S1F1_CYPE1|nr:uncharacterized protein HMPREF1541_01664 [Cyphellophora europaea CBS 101466]ETN42507.1 hypothetical protein HMPREF1541_01664 [Cyphellophora europaea CBS 101466]
MRPGIQREMEVMYQQPHLVPPMKMTIWDEMPPTPPPSMPTKWMSHGRDLASRASERASQTFRRHTPLRPSISSPMPVVVPRNASPIRRRSYRPLELSIYLPNNRLSDLPDFDAVSFIDSGEIRMPPRALLRARSVEVVPSELPARALPVKPASMFERRRSLMRRDTVVSHISDSRPSSSYEALHSHPVSWVALPGGEPQIDMASKPQNPVTVLSPMQEEFTPPCTASLIHGMVMDFPKIEASRANARHSALNPPAPSPKVFGWQGHQDEPVELPATPVPASGAISKPAQEPECEPEHTSEPEFHVKKVPQYSASAYQSQRRVSQWLGGRSHSGSVSTIGSNSTTSSFAEHRKKRSQFYLLSANQYSPPRPLKLAKPAHQHHRTTTVSTMASTVETVTSDYDDIESMTTAPTTTDLQSRSGTIKSVSTATGLAPMGLRPIVSGIPDLPSDYDEVVAVADKDMDAHVVIREINGPLRSPIGIAF